MVRGWDANDAEPEPLTPPPAARFVLPSRQTAASLLASALESSEGPILLTGEPGIGKTWLRTQVAAGVVRPGRWVTVEAAGEQGPEALVRAIARAIGLDLAEAREPGAARTLLADFLAEQAADTRTWGVVVEEAHRLSAEALEDVRRLVGGPHAAGGSFRACLVVGQTALRQRLTGAACRAFAARISGRVHLLPIDADEARELLVRYRPERTWAPAAVERLHRDAAGNPARLLKLAATDSSPSPSPRTVSTSRVPTISVDPRPLLGQTRPPLSVDEDSIEVGWSPDMEETASPPLFATTLPSTPPPPIRVERPAPIAEPAIVGVEMSPHVRIDEQHTFTPYGPLFSRSRPIKDQDPE